MMEDRRLRAVVKTDCDQLFAWVNSPDSLVTKALTTGAIPKTTHDAWFLKCLQTPSTQINIIESKGIGVGQVRLQKDDLGRYDVDIYIIPEFRGQGLASWAVHQAIETLAKVHPNSDVIALVRVENVSSAMLFQRAGFVEQERSHEFITFARKAAL